MPNFLSDIKNGITQKAFANESVLEDKPIHCIDCSQDFIWTIGEQTFFRDKGLQNPPKRCKLCKQAKTERIEAVIAAQQAGIKQKIEVTVNCAKCSAQTTVPFYPSQGRPVFCRTCFIAMNPEILSNEPNGNSNKNFNGNSGGNFNSNSNKNFNRNFNGNSNEKHHGNSNGRHYGKSHKS